MQGQSDRTRDIDQIPSRKRRTLVKLAPLPMSGFVAQLITAPIERIKIPSRPKFFQTFFLQLRKLQLTCKDDCVTWSTQ